MRLGDVVVVSISIFVVVGCCFLIYYHHLQIKRKEIETEGRFAGDFFACGKKSNVVVTNRKTFDSVETNSHEWPWLTAFVYWPDLEYFCGGSLISEKHVLTGEKLIRISSAVIYLPFLVAHCFQNKGQPHKISPGLVRALLGRHNLKVNELGSIIAKIAKIILHRDWNIFEEDSFDADIALIGIEPIIFSATIRRVCLPLKIEEEVLGTGSVVGWGRSKNLNANVLKPSEISIPALTSQCPSDLQSYSSDRTFCGGFDQRGRSPCEGDSGSGFYQLDRSTKSWIVSGIVSSAIVNENQNGCEENKFTLYTSVSSFIEWITVLVESDKGTEVTDEKKHD